MVGQKENELFEALLKLKTAEECGQFLNDLCTPGEVDELSSRWWVARLLSQKKPYRKISEETGVSTATITRVARFMKYGNDGYNKILKRLGCM